MPFRSTPPFRKTCLPDQQYSNSVQRHLAHSARLGSSNTSNDQIAVHGQQLSLPLIDGPRLNSPAIQRSGGTKAPAPLDVRAFLRQLRALSKGRIVKLTLTRNRSTILSAKPLHRKSLARAMGFPKRVHLRIHRCFVNAPDEVLQAAADYAAVRLSKPRRRATLEVLRNHFDEYGPKGPATPTPSRNQNLQPCGDHHDLSPLYDRLNLEYFEDALRLSITWGAPLRRRRRRRRTIQLGSYQDETRSIRMHPILDRADVPSYVVEAVLHHEMVHAVVPAELSSTGTRRRVHTAEFRQREQEYEHLERAERWLEKHLFRLMGRVERQQQRE